MLLKTRREYTLCFFLFAPLGMAGYSAGTANNLAKPPDRELTTTGSVTKVAAKRDAAKGGQSSPNSAAGGLSVAERLTRLLGDGRKAYREGDLKGARSYFRQALDVDGANAEARRLLTE